MWQRLVVSVPVASVVRVAKEVHRLGVGVSELKSGNGATVIEQFGMLKPP